VKPKPSHYFFAQGWLLFVGPVAMALLLGAGAGRIWWDGAPMPRVTAGAVVTVLCAAVGGLYASLLITIPMFVPLYEWRAKVNGAPFRIGDTVRVLRGRYRDQIGTVYAVWRERGQLRVDLGKPAKDRLEDVFWQTEVLRVD
jgi:hypothetical protein